MSANKLEYLTEDISFLRYFPILYSGIKFFTRNLKSLFLNQNRLVGLPDEIGKQRMITQHIQLKAELSWKWNGQRQWVMVNKRPHKMEKIFL
jgi:hypothetical protein